jgi:hypothetical protein
MLQNSRWQACCLCTISWFVCKSHLVAKQERHGWGTWPLNFAYKASFHALHAVNLRHGTDGFTSPPKEGVLRILSPLKIHRTLGPVASTLPLDHRGRQKCKLAKFLISESEGSASPVLKPIIIHCLWASSIHSSSSQRISLKSILMLSSHLFFGLPSNRSAATNYSIRTFQMQNVILGTAIKKRIILGTPQDLRVTTLRRMRCGPQSPHVTPPPAPRQPAYHRSCQLFEHRFSIVSYAPVICHHLAATSKPIV